MSQLCILCSTNAISFNQNLNSWDVSSVTTMDAICLARHLRIQSKHLNNWDVSSVQSLWI